MPFESHSPSDVLWYTAGRPETRLKAKANPKGSCPGLNLLRTAPPLFPSYSPLNRFNLPCGKRVPTAGGRNGKECMPGTKSVTGRRLKKYASRSSVGRVCRVDCADVGTKMREAGGSKKWRGGTQAGAGAGARARRRGWSSSKQKKCWCCKHQRQSHEAAGSPSRNCPSWSVCKCTLRRIFGREN